MPAPSEWLMISPCYHQLPVARRVKIDPRTVEVASSRRRRHRCAPPIARARSDCPDRHNRSSRVPRPAERQSLLNSHLPRRRCQQTATASPHQQLMHFSLRNSCSSPSPSMVDRALLRVVERPTFGGIAHRRPGICGARSNTCQDIGAPNAAMQTMHGRTEVSQRNAMLRSVALAQNGITLNSRRRRRATVASVPSAARRRAA